MRLVYVISLLFFSFCIANSQKSPPRKNLSKANTSSSPTGGVQLTVTKGESVVIDNGIVQVTFALPGGDVIGIKYKEIDNVLEIKNEEDNRGYWDLAWNKAGGSDIVDKQQATDFSVVQETAEIVEVSFTRKWTSSMDKSIASLNIDKRYIVRKGASGLYVYSILERLEGWPDVDMDQIRVVFKLQKEKFQFLAVSDTRQRVMPMPEDRTTGKPLAFPEAVLLTSPKNPEFEGEVDDKYQYSVEDKDSMVHGWISEKDSVGFWMITPSNEFKAGGPVKQELTSHVGPICLGMFTSVHYAGKDLNTTYRNGEAWKKVFGPVFVYLNSVSSGGTGALWQDAKKQMATEVSSWPYSFPQSKDFPLAKDRGTVSGQLVVSDKYITDKLLLDGGYAYVGLAVPGALGSWQKDSKGYQFWTQASNTGSFTIKNIRAGTYNLYAFVPGVIGDYKYNTVITIKPGSDIKLGVLTFEPPRSGPTLWEIGIPDRKASEFFVPEASPSLSNKLYTQLSTDKFRQYGLWDRYSEVYPKNDLVYNVGSSNYSKDWFFAQVNRKNGNGYVATTWQIVFDLKTVNQKGPYTLQLAVAASLLSEIQVRVNDQSAKKPVFTTGLFGRDNSIARHGNHGLYWLYSVNVPSNLLVTGKNTIYLTQPRDDDPFRGVMYDYIRLEGPKEA